MYELSLFLDNACGVQQNQLTALPGLRCFLAARLTARWLWPLFMYVILARLPRFWCIGEETLNFDPLEPRTDKLFV